MTLSVAQAELMMKNASLADITDLQITICGGGNGAHVAAGYLSMKGARVNVLTRKPKAWSQEIVVSTKASSWEQKGEFRGRLHKVSNRAQDVIPGSNVIIVAAPANAHPALLKSVAPFVDEGAYVGALFAQGGFDWAVKSAFGDRLSRLGAVYGLQNIPWICKATSYGKAAKIIGPKKRLYVASYPVEAKGAVAALMARLYDIPCSTLPNFLSLTLTPSNQIIHPARYYGIFRDWDGKRSYTREELAKRNGLTLYADMDEFSAEQLTMLDNELQQVKLALLQRFPQLDLSNVLPLDERVILHYGEDVADRSSLRQIFATNLGYAGCATPLKEVGPNQFQPNVDCRLFWEDIPFGLCILKNLAELLGNFPTPRIDFMIRWHQQFMGREYLTPEGQLNPLLAGETGTPYKYGIHDVADLVATSLPQEMVNYSHPRSRM